MRKLVLDLIVAEFRSAGTGNHQDVARRDDLSPMPTKEFPYEPPHAVSLRGGPNLAAGRDAEPRWRSLLRAGDDYEM